MNEVVDKVSMRYLWLYSTERLGVKESEKLKTLKNGNIKTAKAYQLKMTLQDVQGTASDRVDAMVMMDKWYKWAVRCRLKPVKEFAKTIKNNWAGVLNYFDSRIINAVFEGTNSIIQGARARVKDTGIQITLLQ